MKKKAIFIILFLLISISIASLIKFYKENENFEIPAMTITISSYSAHRINDLASSSKVTIDTSKQEVSKINTTSTVLGPSNETSSYRISKSKLNNIINLLNQMEQHPELYEDHPVTCHQNDRNLNLDCRDYRIEYNGNSYYLNSTNDPKEVNILKKNLKK